MKKQLLILLLFTSVILSSCKKDNNAVATDMTLNTYSADAKYGRFPATLQLRFESDGTVKLRSSPFEEFVILKYEVGDKNASNTTLRIYGELDKTLYADNFVKGTKINWNTEISRLSYKPEIAGFTVGDYHFVSY